MAKSDAYFPQLDALRFFAVAGVAWSHWLPESTFGLPVQTGVQLFFVLSGFLITGILLDLKPASLTPTANPRPHLLRIFYLRRVIRIFPLFYLTVLFAAWFNISHTRTDYLWHLSYLSNTYFIQLQGWPRGIAHFWSLAVEEQFYLFWPLLVLYLRTDRLPLVFGIVGVSSFLCRISCPLFFPEIPLLEISTLCNLDGFALGALCAHGFRHSHFAFAWLSRHRVETIFLCLALAVVVGLLPLPLGTGKLINFGLLSVAYAALLISCFHGVRGPTRFLVDFPPFQYLGRISYGLYLLHNLAYVPANSLLRRFSFIPDHDVVRVALYTLLTIAGSAALYHFFERPIYRLKDKFPYPPHRSSFTHANQPATSASRAAGR